MWKAAVGNQVNIKDNNAGDDDWETDPDFINDVSEEEQRWGSRTIEGSGRNAGAIDMDKLRKETEEADALRKKKQLEETNPGYGYGGKFGIQQDRMDRSAVGHDYTPKLVKHGSQTDYSTGFGGKFGVQTDRVDKSAVTWDYKEKLEKHSSQKDYSTGFGGKFGVQADRQDQSAVGWDHVEQTPKHESQKDYSVGFGGKFGVQSDRQDKCAVGWDHHEAPQKHESQTDHKIGFGGKFGVQSDRMDKSASSFNEEPDRVGTTYMKVKPDIGDAKPSSLRAKFEQLSTEAPAPAEKPTPKKIGSINTTMYNNQVKTEVPKPVENAPKQLDKSKTAMFNAAQEEAKEVETRSAPKPLDHSKISAFSSNQTTEQNKVSANHAPRQLDQSKMAMFNSAKSNTTTVASTNKVQEEFQQIRKQQQIEEVIQSISHAQETQEPVIKHEVVPKHVPQETIQAPEPVQVTVPIQVVAPVQEQVEAAASAQVDVAAESIYQNLEETELVLEDTGLSAVAPYDYQAAADDEISFDPDDIITHIEMIDEGWWRGLCKNAYGLFPANYVQLQQ